MTEKNEKYNFLAQGIIVVAVSFLIAKAMISDFSYQGITSGIRLALENLSFWLIVVIPFVFSPFYFWAALTRNPGQTFGSVSIRYATSMLFSVYLVIWGMPLIGIYLGITTLLFYIYAYRANHS